MSWVKDNGGAIAVAAVALAIGAAYLEWRISVAVTGEIEAVGLISPATIDAMKDDIADQKETHNRDSERMDGKIERIVDILLEE